MKENEMLSLYWWWVWEVPRSATFPVEKSWVCRILEWGRNTGGDEDYHLQWGEAWDAERGMELDRGSARWTGDPCGGDQRDLWWGQLSVWLREHNSFQHTLLSNYIFLLKSCYIFLVISIGNGCCVICTHVNGFTLAAAPPRWTRRWDSNRASRRPISKSRLTTQ